MSAPELSVTHWDCECSERYIHPNSHKFCPTCGAERDEQPDARQDEVADLDKHWKPREEPPHDPVDPPWALELAERVRILREACEDARKELEAQATYFGPHLDPENNLFRTLRKLESVLETTKEGN